MLYLCKRCFWDAILAMIAVWWTMREICDSCVWELATEWRQDFVPALALKKYVFYLDRARAVKNNPVLARHLNWGFWARHPRAWVSFAHEHFCQSARSAFSIRRLNEASLATRAWDLTRGLVSDYCCHQGKLLGSKKPLQREHLGQRSVKLLTRAVIPAPRRRQRHTQGIRLEHGSIFAWFL